MKFNHTDFISLDCAQKITMQFYLLLRVYLYVYKFVITSSWLNSSFDFLRDLNGQVLSYIPYNNALHINSRGDARRFAVYSLLTQTKQRLVSVLRAYGRASINKIQLAVN